MAVLTVSCLLSYHAGLGGLGGGKAFPIKTFNLYNDDGYNEILLFKGEHEQSRM